MQYTNIETMSLSALNIEVLRMIKKGWKPIGGAFVYKIGSFDYYGQTMIKEDKKDIKEIL